MSFDLGDLFLESGRLNADEKGEVADIIEFVESEWGLGGTGLRLFPVQRVILKAHYGIALDTEKKTVPIWGTSWRDGWRRDDSTKRMLTEAEYMQYLYDEGRCNINTVEPGYERREMALSIGRRSGKTFMSSCIAAYETYKLLAKSKPQAYYGLPDNTKIQLTSVATGKDQASLLFNEVSGHFSKCEYFRPFIANNTQSYVQFQTPADIEKFGPYKDCQNPAAATLKVWFQSCVAKGLRGSNNIVIILDEFAHFTDGSQSSAKAVYDAIVPSISAFTEKDPETRLALDADAASEGRVIMISSPLGRQGHFYRMFQIGMAGGEAGANMLTIQAPTWEVNPTVPTGEFAKQYAKDPNAFFTEYGGEFSDRTRGWIEPEDLLACVDVAKRPRKKAPPRMPHYLGIDLGLAGDGTALAIGHVEQGRVVVDVVDQIKAGEGDFVGQERLEFDDVADWVLDYSRRFFITEGMFDSWAGIPFEQALAKRGLGQIKSVHHTRNFTSEIFKNFKDMMIDKRLVLYDHPIEDGDEHCAYIRELLELQSTYHSKYITTVEAPQVDGKHDDMSDALVRMVWQASQHLGRHPSFGNQLSRRGQPQSKMSVRNFISGRRKMMAGGSHPSRQTRRAKSVSGILLKKP